MLPLLFDLFPHLLESAFSLGKGEKNVPSARTVLPEKISTKKSWLRSIFKNGEPARRTAS